MSIDFPKEEERILKFWNSINAFQRQLELSKGKKPYTFYDGPPFATGMPHVRQSNVKDSFNVYSSATCSHRPSKTSSRATTP
jgi:isoleucyl-tRNA synthetase